MNPAKDPSPAQEDIHIPDHAPMKVGQSKSYQEDEDLNLSDLEEDQRRELLELEMQIENENLTRGERRRL